MPQQTSYAEKQYCLCVGHGHLSKAVPGLLGVKGTGWVKARNMNRGLDFRCILFPADG